MAKQSKGAKQRARANPRSYGARLGAWLTHNMTAQGVQGVDIKGVNPATTSLIKNGWVAEVSRHTEESIANAFGLSRPQLEAAVDAFAPARAEPPAETRHLAQKAQALTHGGPQQPIEFSAAVQTAVEAAILDLFESITSAIIARRAPDLMREAPRSERDVPSRSTRR